MKLLDYIAATRDAASEEDVIKLLNHTEEICTPDVTDRKKMGDLYEEVLGHNPMELYDIHDIEQAFDAIYELAPSNVREQMEVNGSRIMDNCLRCLEEVHEEVVGNIVAQAIKVETGWIDPEMEYQIPLAIIRYLSGEEDGFEIDPDDILPDDDATDDEEDYDNSEESEEEEDELNLALAEMLGDDVD